MNRQLAGLLSIWETAIHAVHIDPARNHQLVNWLFQDLNTARSWCVGASLVLDTNSSEYWLCRKMERLIECAAEEALVLKTKTRLEIEKELNGLTSCDK